MDNKHHVEKEKSSNEPDSSSYKTYEIYKTYERGPIYWISVFLSFCVIFLGINYTFDLRFFVNYFMQDKFFYYSVMAILLCMAFIYLPVKENLSKTWTKRWRFIDIILAILVLGIGFYLALKALDILVLGWERFAPLHVSIISIILWGLIIELVRRSAGNILAVIILIFSTYPIYAEYLPGIMRGVSRPLLLTAQYHILGSDSATGMLLQLFCSIIIGYTIFGRIMVATGGGDFFLKLSLSILGKFRGGTAKVAVISSALFGSISGSPISNVITTGSFTIPAMKKSGYSSEYAGAVECCASTAGTLTPPVMGVTAFVMASFLKVNYVEVAIAALIPISLYYLSLFVQIDLYAAKTGLKGIQKSEIPNLKKTLIDGWIFLPSMLVLIYVLFFMRSVRTAPYYAAFTMFFLAQLKPSSRFTLDKYFKTIIDCGKDLMQLAVVIIGVGFLLGSFSITGIGMTFPRELLQLAHGNGHIMLVMCALASLIMGMGMTLIACYIFLSIVIAPALILAGFDPMATHFFVIYYGMLSYITPPVAMAAYPAANIAHTSPMRVGLKAMRLGTILFLLPFFFAYDLNFISHFTSLWGFVLSITKLMLGIIFLAMAFEGYFYGVGKVTFHKKIRYILVGVLLVGTILLGLPGTKNNLYGALIIFVAIFQVYFPWFRKRYFSNS